MSTAVLTCAALAAGSETAAVADDSVSCREVLRAMSVDFEGARGTGIRDPIRVFSRLGGIKYNSYKKGKPLLIDCTLAVSLARVGPALRQLGVDTVTYSSAHDRRFIRGTKRLSRHSFGLAIDIHTFSVRGMGTLKVKLDFEQGLGDNRDCLGDPLTAEGRVMRAIECEMRASGEFRRLLGPDFDQDHYNHFHLEAPVWNER